MKYIISIKVGHIRFHSPLLTESRLIFFPLVTKMFQFTKCIYYWFSKRRSTDHWGLQRVEHLPVAFRCITRPSNALPRHPPKAIIYQMIYFFMIKCYSVIIRKYLYEI